MKEKLLDIISRETGYRREILSMDTPIDSLGIDSLEFVELMLAISNEIGEVPRESYPSLQTVRDIVMETKPKNDPVCR